MQPEIATADPSLRRGDTTEETLGRVLLVDDGDTNRMIAAAMLRRAGYVVDEAYDGAEAVAMTMQHSYAAVLMDLAMPVMDGMEATISIRGLPKPHCDTPIVALTAHDTPTDRMRCLEAGMDDYLSKPLRYTQLIAVMRRTTGDGEALTSKRRATAGGLRDGGSGGTPIAPETVDDSKLKQLELDAGKEAMRNLISMFLTEAKSLSSVLLNTGNRKDSRELERTAHSLKSSSAAFGASALEAACAAAEKAFANADIGGAAAALDNLAALVDATERALKDRGLA